MVRLKDWFAISALVSPAWIILGSALGLYGVSNMSPHITVSWVLISVLVAGAAWWSGAVQIATTRESNSRMDRLFELVAAQIKLPLPNEIANDAFDLTTEVAAVLTQYERNSPFYRVAIPEFLRVKDVYDRDLEHKYREQFAGRALRIIDAMKKHGAVLPHEDNFYLRPNDMRQMFEAVQELTTLAYKMIAPPRES
jgi:hypothetical protein